MTKGSPLPAVDRKRLSALVERDGEAAVLKRLGCSRQTLYRAMAGLSIYAGTAALVREQIEQPKEKS